MGDLKAINAALRLGDPAVPPVGTVLDLGGSALWEVTRLEECSLGVKVYVERVDGARTMSARAHIVISGPWHGQVALLPADAPPFTEWDRCNGLQGTDC